MASRKGRHAGILPTKSTPGNKKRYDKNSGSDIAQTQVVAKPSTISPRKRKAVGDENETQSTKIKRTNYPGRASNSQIRPKGRARIGRPGFGKKPGAKLDAPLLNHPPTEVLDIYVFGEGSAGELGLGAGRMKDVMNAMRPRFNPRLAAESIGVVYVAVGGMHCAALTHDNKILTWGVNDQGALGRETDAGSLVDMEDGSVGSDSDSQEDSGNAESGLNASEAEPRQVEAHHFPENAKFAKLVAADSATFVLTTTGLVYGWGTFRGNDGLLGFRQDGPKVQNYPVIIPELKNITSLATGTNHILALDTKGRLFAWGAGEQNQLGRRVLARTATSALTPREFRLRNKKFSAIGCGDYHSYAIDTSGVVYAWGLNSYAQCGLAPTGNGSDTVKTPTAMQSLNNLKIKSISGGAHHGIALTMNGNVLTWGRADNNQAGVDLSLLSPDVCYRDEHGKVHYLLQPTIVPSLDCTQIASSSDTCAAITKDGKAYTWGFNENYQAGQGNVESVAIAQVVDNAAIRGKKLVFAGIGGQFGILGSTPQDI